MIGLMVAAALAGSGLITLYLMERVWTGRRRVNCMTGMMVAMTGGMLVGLIAGVVAAGRMPGPLWPPTLVGMGAGILAGTLLGLPVSLMAVLDGGLAGLMGGMMGAMLGIMAPEAVPVISGFLVAAYLVGSAVLTIILRQETGAGLRLFPPAGVVALVVAAFVLGLVRSPLGGSDSFAPMPMQNAGAGRHEGHRMTQTETPDRPEVAELSPSPVAAAPAIPLITVELKASDFAFDQEMLRISKGQPVRLVLRNRGQAEHDFVIKGLEANVKTSGRHGEGVHAHTLPGETEIVEFVPLRAGKYEAICTVPGHREAGMRVAIDIVG